MTATRDAGYLWYARLCDAWDKAPPAKAQAAEKVVQAFAEGRITRDRLRRELCAVLGVRIGEWA